MKTSMPFGFISYNTTKYLKHVMQSLVDEKIISRCACWHHYSTGDNKDHFHCYVEPTQQMDTESIRHRFIELNNDGNQQSIAMLPKCKSKFIDAYLYGIHESNYLAYKGLKKEEVDIDESRHFYIGDFKNDIEMALDWNFKVCVSAYDKLYCLIEQGYRLPDVYRELRIPFAQFGTVKSAYQQVATEINSKRKEEERKREIEEFNKKWNRIEMFKPKDKD